MKTIHKYEVPVVLGESFTIKMPCDRHWSPQILTVQMQGDKACVWAIVDTDYEMEPQEFIIVGTGQELPFDPEYGDRIRYVGTFQATSYLVFHLFEVL